MDFFWIMVPTVYLSVSLAAWVVLGRQYYRELVTQGSYELAAKKELGYRTGFYSESRYTAEEKEKIEQRRLELCRNSALKEGTLGLVWPVALIVAPFYLTGLGLKWAITSGVDKELEEKKQLAKAQKIVDDYNAKKKRDEDKLFDELLGNTSRKLKCPMCGLPHREEDCDAEDEDE
jgi:hypothetical protein